LFLDVYVYRFDLAQYSKSICLILNTVKMKKSNFKSLKLNKQSVSDLSSGKLKGGTIIIAEPSNGCTDGCDQTFSCPQWSCNCPC